MGQGHGDTRASREIIIMEVAVLNYIALELQKLIIYYKATDCNSIISLR